MKRDMEEKCTKGTPVHLRWTTYTQITRNAFIKDLYILKNDNSYSNVKKIS